MAERDPDPYVFYTIVRRSLKMSTGKACSQCQHAMDYLDRGADRLVEETHAGKISPEDLDRFSAYRSWRYSTDHAKIVLGATDDDFDKVVAENPASFTVTDLGYTQVEPNTVTCVGLWPMRKSHASATVKTLRPL